MRVQLSRVLAARGSALSPAMGHAIAAAHVDGFVDQLFGDDLHAMRVVSLARATTGVLRSASLGIHAIGRGLAAARGSSSKHTTKQVDRLLSNENIDVDSLFDRWVPYVLAGRSEAWIALDWTDFRKDGQATLIASIVSSHGRATHLMWKTV